LTAVALCAFHRDYTCSDLLLAPGTRLNPG